MRTRTLMQLLLVLAVASCSSKDADPPAPPAPATKPPAPKPAAPTPPPDATAKPTLPPEVSLTPVVLFAAGTQTTTTAHWKPADVTLELATEIRQPAAGQDAVSVVVAALAGDNRTELHSCSNLHAASGDTVSVQLDSAGALYVVCSTRADDSSPQVFTGVRYEWNATTASLAKAGSFEAEQVFEPDTMEFGEQL